MGGALTKQDLKDWIEQLAFAFGVLLILSAFLVGVIIHMPETYSTAFLTKLTYILLGIKALLVCTAGVLTVKLRKTE